MDHPLKQISWQVALLKESKGFGSPTGDETVSGHTERGRGLPPSEGEVGRGEGGKRVELHNQARL